MHPNYLYIEACHLITHKAQKIFSECLFQHFPESQICSQTSAPPENYVQIFRNEKNKLILVQHLINILLINYISFIKYLYFLRYCSLCAGKFKI